jgi:hypothetical protein
MSAAETSALAEEGGDERRATPRRRAEDAGGMLFQQFEQACALVGFGSDSNVPKKRGNRFCIYITNKRSQVYKKKIK